MKFLTRQRLWQVAYAVFAAGMLLALALGIAGYFFLRPYYLRAQAYDLKKLSTYKVATIFQDRSGLEIGRLFLENRVLLNHDEIPEAMRKAVVAAEDRRFYRHPGVDPQGGFRALRENLRSNSYVQGGSTLTQQLAKHLIGRFERTLDRKLVEAFLALRIEQAYTKAEILDFYLNRIYFGQGYFGLEAAAEGYFGKEASKLTLQDCAALAAVIRAPNTFSLRRDPEAAVQRRNAVLRQMEQQGLTGSSEAAAAMKMPLWILKIKRSTNDQSYFLALATKELRHVLSLDEDEPLPQGLTVRTTLDLTAQWASEASIQTRLGNSPDSPLSELQAAAVALDVPTGGVRVLIGGRDYQKSPFDRARMSRRENGPLLQPFLYALAFERLNLNPASRINASYLDEMTLRNGEKPGLGNPDDDWGKLFLLTQDALALGNPSAALRVEMELGRDSVDQWLRMAGTPRTVCEKPPFFSDLSLYDLTSLYQALGNDGKRIEPYCIETIINDNNEVIYEAPKKAGTAVLSPMAAQQMTLTLQATAWSIGTKLPNEAPMAGMRGSSPNYRDAWFVGYTPGFAAGVWIGYDKPAFIGPEATVSRQVSAIWGDIIQRVEAASAPASFTVPKELVRVEVSRQTGLLQERESSAPMPGSTPVYLKPEQVKSLRDRAVAEEQMTAGNWGAWINGGRTSPFPKKSDAPGSASLPPLSPPPVLAYRIPGIRGNILTADGQVLATTTTSRNLLLSWPSPETAPDEESSLKWVRERLDLVKSWIGDDADLSDDTLRSLHRHQKFNPILVTRNLSTEQAEQFLVRSLAQQNFSLQNVPLRFYPQRQSLGQVIGYLQRVQSRSLKEFQAGDVIYDDYRGTVGIEALLDQDLRGSDGRLLIETAPEGFARRVRVATEAGTGNAVRLTIDSQVQAAAEKAFGESQTGAIVVMNVQNGDLVAMVSRPGFDPNGFIPFLSLERWRGLSQDPGQPLLDRVYRQHNPPGSIFKIVTTLAAMRAGVFDPNRAIPCPGYFDVGDLHYALPQERSAPVAFRTAMARSYNTYFFDLGLRAGSDALIHTARSLGLGRPTGFPLRGELGGLIPDDDFVLRTHQRAMGPGDVTNTAIGQGDVLVTPLQMVTLMSALANGGLLHQPRLIRQVEDASGRAVRTFPTNVTGTLKITPDQFLQLRDALVAVTEDGTAKAARVPGMHVAAKTGTAQVGTKSRPRQIAWIVGFLPADAPQYAFALMIEGGWDQDLHGGQDAAPPIGKLFAQVYAPPAPTIMQVQLEDKPSIPTPSPAPVPNEAENESKPEASRLP